jgi:hypothetical protein
MNMLSFSSSIYFAHIMLFKILTFDYIQVICQYRLCKAVHAYLMYLLLQRQLSHLNDRKLNHHQV